MISTFGGLNTLFRGLYTQQVGLDTTGHNISNANTDGYSRQMANLTTTNPQTVYGGCGSFQLGTGVNVESITRARDTFVDRQMWKESASLGYGQTTQDTLGKIEGVFGEPTQNGIQNVLNQFWSAWQTLAVNASDNGARTAVRERGVELADAIQHAGQQLKDMVADINSVLTTKVDNINQINSEIYSLNKQISNIETGGRDHANDLRDRRDSLVDQLAAMANVNVTEDKYGNYTVQSSGVVLVDGNGYTKLTTEPPSQDADYGYEVRNVMVAGTTKQVDFTSGEIKGLLDARDSADGGAKAYLDKLATISQFLLQDFNQVHRTGYGTDNSTNNNFFGDGGSADPDYSLAAVSGTFTKGDWLKALKVNPDLFATGGLAQIAAKTAANGANNASGDNAILLSNRLKVDTSTLLGGASLDTYYSSMIGALGVQTQNATRLTDNQQALVSQIKNWRESVAGVNMDEEMTNMIRFEKGYNAAARVITTMDQMLDKLINNTGMVGR